MPLKIKVSIVEGDRRAEIHLSNLGSRTVVKKVDPGHEEEFAIEAGEQVSIVAAEPIAELIG